MQNEFLPVCRAEMEERGWHYVDFVYVIGDAYVDHPSFGHAIISRVLEHAGYRVGILSQPDVRNQKSIFEFGEPRLGFLVMSGNMDSMVNHYYVSGKRRQSDAYTPGGIAGKRPDYAVNVYCRLIRESFPDKPVITGGIEASLRRLAHYDYWSDSLMPSTLISSGADLAIYGMGERAIVEIAALLKKRVPVEKITGVPGTVYKTRDLSTLSGYLMLPSYKSLLTDRKKYAESFYTQYQNTDPFSSKTLVEAYPDSVYVVQNTPQKPLTQQEMDEVYALPYARNYHPSYEKLGGVPALEEVKFSIASSRGCYGACSFCALTFHQGRIISARSQESILAEATLMTEDPDFKGYIHDVGGPTANFRAPACKKQLTCGACKNRQCLFPSPCKNLETDQSEYAELLRKLRELPKVKKVFVRSGVRFDYALLEEGNTFLKELTEYHVSGQLKVAPEHVSEHVLEKMGKPPHRVYLAFVKKYRALNEALGKEQYLVPYFMSSHPGCTMKDAVELAEYVRDLRYQPEQVQDFYPTPSTLSTCMYYTGVDPRSGEEVYVPKNPHEKAMQRALIQYKNPENYELVREALYKANRQDLIGFSDKCLIRPRRGEKTVEVKKKTIKKTIRNVHKKKGDGK